MILTTEQINEMIERAKGVEAVDTFGEVHMNTIAIIGSEFGTEDIAINAENVMLTLGKSNNDISSVVNAINDDVEGFTNMLSYALNGLGLGAIKVTNNEQFVNVAKSILKFTLIKLNSVSLGTAKIKSKISGKEEYLPFNEVGKSTSTLSRFEKDEFGRPLTAVFSEDDNILVDDYSLVFTAKNRKDFDNVSNFGLKVVPFGDSIKAFIPRKVRALSVRTWVNVNNYKDTIAASDMEQMIEDGEMFDVFFYPSQASQIKKLTLRGSFGPTAEIVMKTMEKNPLYAKYLEDYKNGDLKSVEKSYRRIGAMTTGGVSAGTISKLALIVDSKGNPACLKNPDGSDNSDGTAYLVSVNVEPVIEAHFNSVLALYGNGSVEIIEGSLDGLVTQVRPHDFKSCARFVSKKMVQLKAEQAAEQGLFIKLVNCSSLDEVEIFADKNSAKLGGWNNGESVSLEILAFPHMGKTINTGIQSFKQDICEDNISEISDMLYDSLNEKIQSDLLTTDAKQGLIAKKNIEAQVKLGRIMAKGGCTTEAEQLRFLLDNGATSDYALLKRLTRTTRDAIKNVCENYAIKVSGRSLVAQQVDIDIFDFDLEGNSDAYAPELAVIIDNYNRAKRALAKEEAKDAADQEKLDKLVERIENYDERFTFKKVGKYYRIISKGMKYPATGKDEFVIFRLVGNVELLAMTKAFFEVNPVFTMTAEEFVQEYKNTNDSVLFIAGNDRLFKNLAGCDFDWDHISLYLDKTIVRYAVSAKENRSSKIANIEDWKRGKFLK